MRIFWKNFNFVWNLVNFHYVLFELLTIQLTPWRNGSASDSRSEGCVFKSRRGHAFLFISFKNPVHLQVMLTLTNFQLINQKRFCFNQYLKTWKLGLGDLIVKSQVTIIFPLGAPVRILLSAIFQKDDPDEKKKLATSGNRTRAARVAGEHSTTEPTLHHTSYRWYRQQIVTTTAKSHKFVG